MLKPCLILALALPAGCALVPSGEERVDQPIDDTYQPLQGADWNHRYSSELRELRAWQDARAHFEAEYAPEPGTITATNSVPADRVHEPQPAPLPSSRPAPRIEEDEESLRIRD